jgi:hypothetical protein
MTPVIYDLATDYARYGISEAQVAEILTHRFYKRWGGGVQGAPWEIVLHIQDGRTVGSLIHWSGVQASSTVMIQRDGSILKVIPEEHGPWTNGDVCNPLPEVADLLAKGGNPNIWSLTIEAEGTPWEALTAVQLDSVEWQVRQWMQTYSIPKERVDRHRHINSCSRWNCPGASDANDYYLAIQKRLSGGATTTYANPITYDWLEPDELAKGIDREIGGTTMKACRRLWEVKTQTPRCQKATKNGPKVGPDLMPGETFFGEFVFKNNAGWWVLTEFGTRVYQGDLTEEAAITDRS